jgi:hypothetical protein
MNKRYGFRLTANLEGWANIIMMRTGFIVMTDRSPVGPVYWFENSGDRDKALAKLKSSFLAQIFEMSDNKPFERKPGPAPKVTGQPSAAPASAALSTALLFPGARSAGQVLAAGVPGVPLLEPGNPSTTEAGSDTPPDPPSETVE